MLSSKTKSHPPQMSLPQPWARQRLYGISFLQLSQLSRESSTSDGSPAHPSTAGRSFSSLRREPSSTSVQVPDASEHLLLQVTVRSLRPGEHALPKHVLQLLDEAPLYPEGTSLRLVVRSVRDLTTMRKLVAIKLANSPVVVQRPAAGHRCQASQLHPTRRTLSPPPLQNDLDLSSRS